MGLAFANSISEPLAIVQCPPPSHSCCASVAGSFLQRLALGGFAFTKTILNCFCSSTYLLLLYCPTGRLSRQGHLLAFSLAKKNELTRRKARRYLGFISPIFGFLEDCMQVTGRKNLIKYLTQFLTYYII